jgi:hypothetical protein
LIHHLPEELIEGVEIQSPFMPPKRKFKVQLKIRNIKKGRPSICDAIFRFILYTITLNITN